MKLAQERIEFMETMEMGKLVDIEKKEITVNKVGSYIDKYGDKKVVFTVKENDKNYFYIPNVLVKVFSDNVIEKINDGKDTIHGYFEKKAIGQGRTMWTFTDL